MGFWSRVFSLLQTLFHYNYQSGGKAGPITLLNSWPIRITAKNGHISLNLSQTGHSPCVEDPMRFLSGGEDAPGLNDASWTIVQHCEWFTCQISLGPACSGLSLQPACSGLFFLSHPSGPPSLNQPPPLPSCLCFFLSLPYYFKIFLVLVLLMPYQPGAVGCKRRTFPQVTASRLWWHGIFYVLLSSYASESLYQHDYILLLFVIINH